MLLNMPRKRERVLPRNNSKSNIFFKEEQSLKKRILGILLCLCMVLMLCPVTAFAEGETLTPVTEISVGTQAPVIGEELSYS